MGWRESTVIEQPETKTRVAGFTLPGVEKSAGDGRFVAPHEIALPYPAIEELPQFVCRISSGDLAHGVRHYNGSVALHDGRIFMAYRFESFRAVSSVGFAELDPATFEVMKNTVLEPALDNPETHIEDPHLASVGGRLFVVVSNVVRGFPPVCRQRMLEVDPFSMTVVGEIPMTYGNIRGIEKNWTPFELPDGSLGIVYKQKPRTVISVDSGEGWTAENLAVGPKDSSLSGRTGPLDVGEFYLEFVGGHVVMPHRGTRYWFGAILFEKVAPFKVVHTTGEQPLVWASEASPTIFNPVPRGGHPVCILPAGAFVRGGSVWVSCGVNDSYNVILRFSLDQLMKRLQKNG